MSFDFSWNTNTHILYIYMVIEERDKEESSFVFSECFLWDCGYFISI